MPSSSIRSYADVVADLASGDGAATHRLRVVDSGLLAALVDDLHGPAADAGTTRVELLCSPAVLAWLDGRFLAASRLRDLVDDDVASVRRVPDPAATGAPTTLVGPDRVAALVPLGGGDVAATDVADADARRRLRDRFAEAWADAPTHAVDVPPYSTLLDAAEADLDDGARDEFARAMAVDAALTRGSAGGLGPVERMLLVAARREGELQAVVAWATATGLASQGTVSRAKGRLEAAGVLDTEPVRRGVGRPRQRLRLADESLASRPIAELLSAVDAVYGP